MQRGHLASYNCCWSVPWNDDFYQGKDRIETLKHRLNCLNTEREKMEQLIKKLKNEKLKDGK